MRLDGRTAVVTGAARGIGAAEAIRLAQEGANVAVLDLSAEACQETVEAVEAAGAEAIAIACDVSSAQQVEKAFEEIAHRFGRVDILVNNAGLLRDNLSFKMSEDDWDKVLDVHLKGSFLCSKAAQKYMVDQEYGKIVMTSSIVASGEQGAGQLLGGQGRVCRPSRGRSRSSSGGSTSTSTPWRPVGSRPR